MPGTWKALNIFYLPLHFPLALPSMYTMLPDISPCFHSSPLCLISEVTEKVISIGEQVLIE